MRFVSHIRAFAVGIVQHVPEVTAFGERVVRQGFTAQFKHGDVTADELELAEKVFKGVNGRTLERDEVTQTAMLGRLSTYDTESPENLLLYEALDAANDGIDVPGKRGTKWTAGTTKKLVEEKLTDPIRLVPGGDYVLAEARLLSAPWPNYNDFRGSVDDLVERLVADGYHLPEVLAYERQDLGRTNVIEALEEAIAEGAGVAGEVIPA